MAKLILCLSYLAMTIGSIAFITQNASITQLALLISIFGNGVIAAAGTLYYARKADKMRCKKA